MVEANHLVEADQAAETVWYKNSRRCLKSGAGGEKDETTGRSTRDMWVTIRSIGAVAVMATALVLGTRGSVAGDVPTGETIPPAECVVVGKPVEYFVDLIRTPVPDDGYASPTAIPGGPAPDATVTAEITAAVRQVIACSNTGDTLRALSLFDDAYLRRTIDSTGQLTPGLAADIFASFATPRPIDPADLIQLIRIVELHQIDPTHVSAVVESVSSRNSEKNPTDVDLFVFERRDEGWIVASAVRNIDDVAP